MIPSPPTIARHYGLDWLRIGAFGLLILFHVGLYFAPGHWIVKSPQQHPWVGWFSAAIVPWRLTVLFAVSGYATAAMIQRCQGLGAFLAERSKRLLIPLLFGMLVIIPPQDWVRLRVSGVHHSYADFLLHDAFSFSTHSAVFFPNWEHLWFLPYLWAYTLLLVALFALLPRWRTVLGPAVAWLCAGRQLLYLPALAILAGMVLLRKLHLTALEETADYLPAFVFGVAFSHFAELRAAIDRRFREALAVSIAMLALIWGSMALAPADEGPVWALIDLASSSLMSWAMLIVMFRLADRFLNFDHRLRPVLATAVFPAYIVHQTIIVLVGWYLTRIGVAGPAALLIQLTAVLAGCFTAWWLARTFGLAGVLLGMPHKGERPLARPATLGSVR